MIEVVIVVIAVIIVLTIIGAYILIQTYFGSLIRKRKLQLQTKPILGICPSNWRKVAGDRCIEPGASVLVDKNGNFSGVILGTCKDGSEMGKSGNRVSYCEHPPKTN